VQAPTTVFCGNGLNLIQFQIQTDSNQVQIVSNFDRSKNGLPELQKFGIKYGCEGLEESNKFVHRNFIRLKINFELKIWEVKVYF
jgi:hypothetical protein